MSTYKDIFPKNATFGFKEEAGYWQIDLSLPQDLSIPSLNQSTVNILSYCMDAFSAICRPVEMRYDLMVFDPKGNVELVREGVTKAIDPPQPDQLEKELNNIISDNPAVLIVELFLECDTIIFAPRADLLGNPTWVPGAATFYVGYVMEYNDSNQYMAVDSCLYFKTNIDVWAAATQQTATLEYRNNEAFADLNRPALESALRALELLVAKPINEWHSQYYPDQIFRYGFLPKI